MKSCATTLLVLLFSTAFFAQTPENPWLDAVERQFAKKNSVRRIVPQQYRTLSLHLPLLQQQLSLAPKRFSGAAESWQPVLHIPMPDGRSLRFHLVEAPVMHPDLAAKFPYIRSYAGWSEDDPTAYLRCGITQKGFHGQVLSARHSTVYLDAYAEGDVEHYISYFKKDLPNPHLFECQVDETSTPEGELAPSALVSGDCKHRTYALALACTGEYAQFHGGTKPLVMAEYNIAMTRVNGIYEREVGVTMELIPNTDLLIYLNAASDPYTNNNGSAMLNENQTNVNLVIGSNNYDIGHVFSTGGGGIAALNSVCNANNKARGVTGLPSPVGDPFYVDYVCHEMGHQFGGRHTFNSNQGSCNGNQSNSTAFEPGSGTTIMAYAGICSPHNVQNNSDDYFHAANLDEINAHITGAANGCSVSEVTGNTPPTVTVAASSYTIPKSTPFVLVAQGVDPNFGDTITYCWEQMNNQTATMPPVSTSTGGPLFRSLPPTESPMRYFPNLPAVISNTMPTWEVLPSVGRSLSFQCTVRDNHQGAGCTHETDVFLTVAGTAGPFLVTNPNTAAAMWTAGTTATVTWDVAGTDVAPVGCSQVDILLSVDGGFTYPYQLLSNTPNDGSETVPVPVVTSAQARVMVRSEGNVFYDISNQNFGIQAPTVPTFTMQAVPGALPVCVSGQASFTINTQSLAGFSQAVSFSATGLPAGATASFTPQNTAPPSTVSLLVEVPAGTMPGNYPVTVTAVGGSVTQTVDIVVMVVEPLSQGSALQLPPDGAEVVTYFPTLSWAATAFASEYFVEVAEDPSFASLLVSDKTADTFFVMPVQLVEQAVYYWRIKPTNACGEGAYSAFFAFHLGETDCQTFTASNLPLNIPSDAATSVTATMNIPNNLYVSSLQANLNISHTYVGDLAVQLVSPQGTSMQLFDQPGVPASQFGCENDNIVAGFSDSFANAPSVLENMCNNSPPAISGNFKPLEAFSAVNFEHAQGAWSLKIADNFDEDGGALNTWTLGICGLVPTLPAVLLKNEVLEVPKSMSGTIDQAHLEGAGNPVEVVRFVLLSLPAHGELQLAGGPLVVGNAFTQADINAGNLIYQHNGDTATMDEFLFDFINPDSSWLHAQVFLINILQNVLSASADLTQPISCQGDENATIAVTASGGTAPLSYSLNGGMPQGSPIFSGLGAGSFTVMVTDGNGSVVSTNTIVITAPDALGITATVNLSDINATGSGGTGALEYSLDGVNFQPSGNFIGLPNGTYTVTVRDENGCTATTSAIVSLNTLVATAEISLGISCAGESDGVIVVSALGGNPPYFFSLNGGVPQASESFEDLPAGVYEITVEDADGFTQAITGIVLAEPSQLSVSATVNLSDISATGSGGTGALEYSLDGVNFQPSGNFNGLPNGSYTITVRDENGCTASTTVTIGVNTVVASASVTQQVSCFGGADGTITVTASGGMPPYVFLLNGGAPQSSNVFETLPAGSYGVVVEDADGFTQAITGIVLAEPLQLSVSATVNLSDISATGSGGTGALEYSLDGVNFQPSGNFNGLPNGTYTVTVRDENGCTATATATIGVNTVVASASVTQQVSCFGGADGTITVTASGGMPPYVFLLNGGAPQSSNVFENLPAGSYGVVVEDADGFTQAITGIVLAEPLQLSVSATVNLSDISATGSGGTGALEYSLDGLNFQPSGNFNGLPNGTYTVTVRDENGCTATATATIGVNTVVASASVTQQVSCFGGADGTITVTASGGMPPYVFLLNGGAPQSSNVFENLPAGSYGVVVEDADGFTQAITGIVLAEPAQLAATASASGYTVTAVASGGAGGFEYSLDGGVFQTSNSFFPVANGTHSITVVDENGCETTVDVTVSVPALAATGTVTQAPLCWNTSDGQITLAGSGGVPPYEYSLNGGAFQSNNVFNNLAPGTYAVTIRDSGGFTSPGGTVTVLAPAAMSITPTVVLNNITIAVSGGTGPFDYQLDNGMPQASNVFTGVPNGAHTLLVVDANGCEVTGTVIVGGLPPNIFVLTQQGVSCNGAADAVLQVNASSGTPPYQYSLNGGSFQNSNIFSNLPAGSYTVTVMGSDGATSVAPTVIISDPPALSVAATVFGLAITASGTGGTGSLSYSLNGGSFQSNSVFNVAANGSYTVTVMDAKGCMATTTVSVNAPVAIATSVTPESCDGEADGTIVIQGVTGGQAPYLYALNGGLFTTATQYTGLSSGVYTITVQDATGYQFTAPDIVINAPTAVTATTVLTGNDLTINVLTGTPPYLFSVDGGISFSDNNVFNDLANGLYQVVVVDENGCTFATEIPVQVDAIGELAVDGGLLVFPNPGAGLFQLSLGQPLPTAAELSVCDVLGRVVFSEKLPLGTQLPYSLDLQGLPNGPYCLRLRALDGAWGVAVVVVKQ